MRKLSTDRFSCVQPVTQLMDRKIGIKPGLSVSPNPCWASLPSVSLPQFSEGSARAYFQALNPESGWPTWSSGRVQSPSLPSWLGCPSPRHFFWDSKIEAPGSVFPQKISTSIFISFPEAEETQFMLIAVYQTSWFLTPWIFLPLKAPTTCENEHMANCSALFASHTWWYFVAS